MLFYTSLIGACDHLFFGRHAMSRATGVGPVTDEVCRQYIRHMEALICGGMLTTKQEKGDVASRITRFSAIRYSPFAIRSLEKKRPRKGFYQCS